jgi:2-polyprenyl-6-methoxyphenol hydroxylase-like FAD-dependent oxidoreductase
LNRQGRCLQRMRPRHEDFPALSLHRADLQFLFLEEVSANCIRLGCEIRGFRQGTDSVDVALASGETLSADALIGADGLRSAVRDGRFGVKPPEYSGYVGWRGVSPWIPPQYAGEHLTESWAEGKRFGISPMGNGRCYWYATATRPAGGVSCREDCHAELQQLFGHWHAPISALIDSTPVENILLSDIYDRPAQHPWTDGVVTLLGDAAHPMTPNLGQGACFALEDACVLARCVDHSRELSHAFKQYEDARRSRTDAVQRRSRWLGKLIQFESPPATALRDFMLLSTPDRMADFSMRGLFSFKP